DPVVAARAADARPRGRRARGRDLPRQRGALEVDVGAGVRVIALVQGEVAVRRGDHVVVLCAGVGYRLNVSAETLSHVPRIGEPVTLFTHLIVREDAMTLMGFATEEERDLFLLLISVQGVGPKMALAVLSGGPPPAGARGARASAPLR